MPTVYDFLSPDETEVEEQRIIRAPGATTGDVLTVQADKTVSPAPGGGSLPGTLALRRSAVFEHAAIGYNAGSGFALFDTGLTLAAGEEVVIWYRHIPQAFTSATGLPTDFTFSAYLGPTGEGDSLGNSGNDGNIDSIGAQMSQMEALTGSFNYGLCVSGTTIDVDTPVFGYLSGPNESLTAGKVAFVLIVAAAP